MSNIYQELRLYEEAKFALRRAGIGHRAFDMVLFAMCVDGCSYVEAVKLWAAYETPVGWDAVAWNNWFATTLAVYDIQEGPGAFFDRLRKEVCHEQVRHC